MNTPRPLGGEENSYNSTSEQKNLTTPIADLELIFRPCEKKSKILIVAFSFSKWSII